MAALIREMQGPKNDATVSLWEASWLGYTTVPEAPRHLSRQQKAAVFYPNRSIVARLLIYCKTVSSSGSWELHFQGLLKFFSGTVQPLPHFIFRNLRCGEPMAQLPERLPIHKYTSRLYAFSSGMFDNVDE